MCDLKRKLLTLFSDVGLTSMQKMGHTMSCQEKVLNNGLLNYEELPQTVQFVKKKKKKIKEILVRRREEMYLLLYMEWVELGLYGKLQFLHFLLFRI